MLQPEAEHKIPYVTRALDGHPGPVVAVSDWIRAVPDQIARWVPAPFTSLGTDGWGFSDTRPAARRFFHVDAESITVAVLARAGPARRGQARDRRAGHREVRPGPGRERRAVADGLPAADERGARRLARRALHLPTQPVPPKWRPRSSSVMTADDPSSLRSGAQASGRSKTSSQTTSISGCSRRCSRRGARSLRHPGQAWGLTDCSPSWTRIRRPDPSAFGRGCSQASGPAPSRHETELAASAADACRATSTRSGPPRRRPRRCTRQPRPACGFRTPWKPRQATGRRGIATKS